MTLATPNRIEVEDIQRGVLQQRPSPYVGTYLLLRIDNPDAGRELVRRLHRVVESARTTADPDGATGLTVAFTFQGLVALGVPQQSLDSFAPEFREGMAARAVDLGDVGESSPANWEKPLGSADVHVALAVLSPDTERLETVRRASAPRGPGLGWRGGDLASGLLPAPDGSHLIRVQGRHRAAHRRGNRRRASPPGEQPIKAGEFLLGYPDETGSLPPMPSPEVLGRNGTYIVFRKLHTRVAAYRQYLRARDRQPRGGRAARREDGRTLAERRAARACPGSRCPGSGRRSRAQQQLRLR